MLRPFFSFYGGKWRAAPRYPKPAHSHIIEPFAGSAGYALRYPYLQVTLIEKDPQIGEVWRYLTRVSASEILRLPDLPPSGHVDGMALPQEARWLVGWWCQRGGSAPNKSLSAWGRDPRHRRQFWGPTARQRIAGQVEAIRHWTIVQGDYRDAPDIPATWFIDPPYQSAGRHYRHGAAGLDYQALSEWCRSRRGQVLVCENEGADWLPFRPLFPIKANESASGGKVSREAIWEATCAA